MHFYGKSFLQSSLQTAIQRNVDVGELFYQFPFGFRVRNFNVEGVLQAKEVRGQISLESAFSREIQITSVHLIEPIVTVEKIAALSGVETVPETTSEPDSSSKKEEVSKPEIVLRKGVGEAKKRIKIRFNHIFVEDGQVSYIRESGDKDFSFRLEDVDLKVDHFVFPMESVETAFQISAVLKEVKDPFLGSVIEGEGMVNVVQKDMDGTFQLIQAGQDSGLTAHMVSKNNNMVVDGQVNMNSSVLASKAQKKEESLSVDNLIFGALSSMGIEIEAQFSFETKMDDFRIENISFSGGVGAKNLLPQ